MQQTTRSAGRGRSVVVIEDNPSSRRLVRDLLEFEGFIPVEAGSAEEGLPLVSALGASLVLLDIQLPGMDGAAALRSLRADPLTSGVVAVAVTAYAMRGDEERLLAAGFDAYLPKPIDTRAFVPTLVALLDAHGS